MKTFDIVRFGDPVLREEAAPVRIFHRKFQVFVDALAETLAKAQNGAALAAPQVAELKRVTVMHYKGEYLELVNPRIVAAEGDEDGEEGCLSFPGYFGHVRRHTKIEVVFQDRKGAEHRIEREGPVARCLQHEIDHLDGILFIDRMTEPFLEHAPSGKKFPLSEALALAGPARPRAR